jgi:hypothetical protein
MRRIFCPANMAGLCISINFAPKRAASKLQSV